MRVTLNYATIMAAGRDAGNRSMRKAGRKRWSLEDYRAAQIVTDHLFSLIAS